MCCRICPFASSSPMPNPSTPTLLLMVVRFFTPLRPRARIRFSGMPHSPNPPTMMVAPSKMSRMASSALATTLFIGKGILNQVHHRDREPWRTDPRFQLAIGFFQLSIELRLKILAQRQAPIRRFSPCLCAVVNSSSDDAPARTPAPIPACPDFLECAPAVVPASAAHQPDFSCW